MRYAVISCGAALGVLAGPQQAAVLRRRPTPRDASDVAAVGLFAGHADRPVGDRLRRTLAARARLRPAKKVRTTKARPRHQNGPLQTTQKWQRQTHQPQAGHLKMMTERLFVHHLCFNKIVFITLRWRFWLFSIKIILITVMITILWTVQTKIVWYFIFFLNFLFLFWFLF